MADKPVLWSDIMFNRAQGGSKGGKKPLPKAESSASAQKRLDAFNKKYDAQLKKNEAAAKKAKKEEKKWGKSTLSLLEDDMGKLRKGKELEDATAAGLNYGIDSLVRTVTPRAFEKDVSKGTRGLVKFLTPSVDSWVDVATGEGTKGDWGNVALDSASFLPGVGIAGRAAGKGAKSALLGKALETTGKNTLDRATKTATSKLASQTVAEAAEASAKPAKGVLGKAFEKGAEKSNKRSFVDEVFDNASTGKAAKGGVTPAPEDIAAELNPTALKNALGRVRADNSLTNRALFFAADPAQTALGRVGRKLTFDSNAGWKSLLGAQIARGAFNEGLPALAGLRDKLKAGDEGKDEGKDDGGGDGGNDENKQIPITEDMYGLFEETPGRPAHVTEKSTGYVYQVFQNEATGGQYIVRVGK